MNDESLICSRNFHLRLFQCNAPDRGVFFMDAMARYPPSRRVPSGHPLRLTATFSLRSHPEPDRREDRSKGERSFPNPPKNDE